ncbi:MAG: gliding motility-associated protein GldM [Cyclobacteriaceae bacterium]|jgi:gliding motility-associated protein GldM
MSGGKQSARDKMIGMMYLVLTALLALQVSNSVLEKFLLINDAFEETNNENKAENANKVESIQKAVTDNGNRPKDQAVLDKAKTVRESTKTILKIIEEYKTLLVLESGGRDEKGVILGKKDIDTAPRIFVKQEEGKVLKGKLNGYSANLRTITGDNSIKDIARDAKDIAVFADDPNQNEKGFADLNFGHNTPMVGALASLSQFQNDVITEETKALETLAAEVGAQDLKFDLIVPMVKPVSNIVASGTKYEAEMFIAASASGMKPTMTYNGNDIEVIGGKGQISFTASASSYDKEGLSRQTFIGAINVPIAGGADTTFRDTITYFVSKPVIQVRSATVDRLYLGCGNELNVQVPALGTAYNPSFTVKGGSSVQGATRGFVTVVPASAKVTLGVSSNGNKIGDVDYGVSRIPAPEVTVLSGRKPVDLRKGVAVRSLRGLAVRAIPDESFKSALPKDANFRVTKVKITLGRGGRAVNSVNSTSENIGSKIGALAGQARAGDILQIETVEVMRANFRKDTEKFPNYSGKFITVPVI